MADNAPNKKTPDKEKNTNAASLKSEFYAEEKQRAAATLSELKNGLAPTKIAKYIASRLWKPVLAFTLLFSLFLGGAYAANYYKLLNAGTALNFESMMPPLRASDNKIARELLPVAEWAVSVLSAAGEIIQYRVERQEALKLKEEEEIRAKKAEEERLAAIEEEKRTAGEKGGRQEPPAAANAEDETRKRESERKRQDDELKKAIAARQQELNKRAGKLALYYSSMPAADAVRILKNMENDEIILILSNMPDALASQILAGFEPERASAITKNILKLHPSPTEEATLSAGVL
ncbi:MAG: hypothetical protein LBO03_00295 [Acidaminococcales bacterium]|nr:hypothetical protein [Acidaminococcales bacterium]